MAVLKMQKIRIGVHRDAASEAAEVLQELGVLEVTTVGGDESLEQQEKTDFELNYISSRIDFAISFLAKYERKNSFKKALEGDAVPATHEEMVRLAREFYYKDVIERVNTLIERINELEVKNTELSKEREILSSWTFSDIPLSEQLETEYTKIRFIKGDPRSLSSLEEALIKNTKAHIEKGPDGCAVIAHLHSEEKTISEALKVHAFEDVTLPRRRGTPSEEIERIDRALKKTEKTLATHHAEAYELSEHLTKLRIISDHIRWRKDRYDLVHEAACTETTLILEGWCPSKATPRIEKELSRRTPYSTLSIIETDEEPPVEIENNSLAHPFEPVTRLYGLPGARDLDPTPYLAGFFFIFFGFCLSDVGYGVILTSFTASVLFFLNLPYHTATFFKLFMAGGISSIIGGVIFGGYLGVNVSLLPQWLQTLNFFDPLGDPLPIFFLALALGVIQILLGMVLAIVREARNGTIREGLLSNGPWFSLFIALALWVSESFGYIPALDNFNYVWLVYASLIAIVLAEGRHQKNPFAVLGVGLIGLYNSINYLSDVLSYSRLLAIGLATSALAFSVNLIALMAYDALPYIGWIALILVLIVGHFFNLVVNVLGAFIHTARLQFVEFFGKFISGTGRAFEPFHRKSSYVILQDEKKR